MRPLLAHLSATTDVASVLERGGLDRDVLWDTQLRVPWDVFTSLWDKLTRATDDDTLGLRLAKLLTVRVFHHGGLLMDDYPLMRAFAHATTVGRALQHYCDYSPIGWGPVRFSLRRANDLRVSVEFPQALPVPVTLAEYTLLFPLLLLRDATAAPIVPLRVQFGHLAPKDVARYASDLRCQPAFGGTSYEFVLPHEVEAWPLLATSPASEHEAVHAARLALQALQLPDSFAGRVRATIDSRLRSRGALSAQVVAHSLSMSVRTMSRHLANDQVTFRELVAHAQVEFADELLAASDSKVSEVARRVGFADATAFRRAYRRQRGKPPRGGVSETE